MVLFSPSTQTSPLDQSPIRTQRMNRPLVWFVAPFALTLWIAGKLPLWMVTLGAAVALCQLLRMPRGRGRPLLTVALAVTLGLGWFCLFHAGVTLATRSFFGEQTAFTATVTRDATETDYGSSVRVTLHTRYGPGVPALLYLDEMTDLRPGDTLTGTADFVSGMVREEGDLSSWASDGVFLIGSVEEESHTPGDSLQAGFFPQFLCHAIQVRIDQLFDPDCAALLRALFTRDRSRLSSNYTDALQRVGLSHLFAVSGLHVSFLVSLFFLLAGNSRWCSWLCLPILVLFCLMTGCSPSVMRAALMASFYLIAPFLGRESDGLSSLAAALLLLLLQNPFAAGNIGLQLSFTSMLGIIQVTPRLLRWMSDHLPQPRQSLWYRVCSFVSHSLAMTVGACLFTIPLVAYYFGYVSLIAPLSNLLVLEIVAFFFSMGGVAVLVSFLCMPLGAVLALLLKPLGWYVMNLPIWLSRVPFAALSDQFQIFYLWIIGSCLIGILTFCSKALRKRFYFPCGAIVLLLVASLVLFQVEMNGTGLLFQALDVGQGQSLLFYSKGQCFAIDCGGKSDAGAQMAAALRDLQQNKLEGLALTHYDRDHCNGVEELLQQIPVDTLYLPDVEDDSENRETIVQAAQDAGVPIQWVTQDETLSLGGATLTLYAPLEAEGTDNERCLTARCRSGTFDVLVTGDIDAQTEEQLAERKDLRDIEVLVTAHHGSRFSTSSTFLETIEPEYAVISVGNNRYGHPTQEVLQRLREAGCDVYRTDLNGTVSIRYQEE